MPAPSPPLAQTLLAGESTTLSVLFLAREEGAALGSLVLETNVGGFIVQVLRIPNSTSAASARAPVSHSLQLGE